MTISRYLGRVCLSLLSCLLFLTLQGFGRSEYDPYKTYHAAWQIVRDGFYDDTYNGQDWSTWEHKFNGRLNSPSDAQAAIKTMLASLNDRYTRVLDPNAYGEELGLIDSHLVGIGVMLEESSVKGHLVIDQIVDGSPAMRAGIMSGDELVGVDGQFVSGLPVETAGKKISGREGTFVSIAVNRNNAVRTFKIKREQLLLHSVTYKVLSPNIGYINVSNFLFDDAAREFKVALEKLSGTDGLIIDVRRNPGGLITNAIRMASMLIDEGPIVTTISRRETETDVASGTQVTNKPIVLLVDKDSASASEILAAALKEHGRAVLVGTKTFGKGLVQQIVPLPDGGALHVTVAHYISPRGAEINKVGISPNIEVADQNKQMETALNLLKNRITAEKQGRQGISSLSQPKERT